MPAARPMASLRRDFSSDNRTPSTPPASTCTPASRAGCAAARTRAAIARVTAPPSTLSSTCASPVRSSLLSRIPRPPGVYGPTTLSTCGAARILRTDSSTARLTTGSSSVPRATWNTTGLWPFC